MSLLGVRLATRGIPAAFFEPTAGFGRARDGSGRIVISVPCAICFCVKQQLCALKQQEARQKVFQTEMSASKTYFGKAQKTSTVATAQDGMCANQRKDIIS